MSRRNARSLRSDSENIETHRELSSQARASSNGKRRMGLAQKLLNTQKLSGISHHRLQARSREAKPVLVLGGAGYLGSVLVRRLLRRGFAVRVLDALLFGSRSLAEFRGNGSLELIEGDLRD